MFGGLGIYSEGLFFAVADDGRLYFKVSDLNRPDFEAAGMGPFYYSPDAPPMNYWELPPGVLDDPEELKVWFDKAIEVADHAKRKKPQRSRNPREDPQSKA